MRTDPDRNRRSSLSYGRLILVSEPSNAPERLYARSRDVFQALAWPPLPRRLSSRLSGTARPRAGSFAWLPCHPNARLPGATSQECRLTVPARASIFEAQNATQMVTGRCKGGVASVGQSDKATQYRALSRGAGRIRTAAWRFCRPLPYHLATAPAIAGQELSQSPADFKGPLWAKLWALSLDNFEELPHRLCFPVGRSSHAGLDSGRIVVRVGLRCMLGVPQTHRGRPVVQQPLQPRQRDPACQGVDRESAPKIVDHSVWPAQPPRHAGEQTDSGLGVGCRSRR